MKKKYENIIYTDGTKGKIRLSDGFDVKNPTYPWFCKICGKEYPEVEVCCGQITVTAAPPYISMEYMW